MVQVVAITLGRVLLALFVLLGLLLAANTLTYLNFDPTYGFLRLKEDAIATGWYLPFYYAHVLTGGIILAAGFIQFNQRIRQGWKSLHRIAGYFYVMGVLCFAAPGGMVMSFFINRGPLVMLSFIVQCSLWSYFTLTAFQLIKGGRVDEHRNWMIRSFALTLAAITLRIYIFGASWFIDLNQPAAYATIALLSWVPNFLFAELIIRKKITSTLLS